MIKAVSILGSTGSIGRQSIAAAKHLGVPVVALTANKKIDLVEQQARELKPQFVAIFDENAANELKIRLADTDIRVGSGMQGLIEAATLPRGRLRSHRRFRLCRTAPDACRDKRKKAHSACK